LTDFTGRTLVAAGLGGGIVANLAQEKLPTTGIREWTMAITGFALIFLGIDWQSRSEADKEHGGV